jgi:hypothetical protein
MIWALWVETAAGPLMFGMFPEWLHCEFVRSLLPVAAECLVYQGGGAGS